MGTLLADPTYPPEGRWFARREPTPFAFFRQRRGRNSSMIMRQLLIRLNVAPVLAVAVVLQASFGSLATEPRKPAPVAAELRRLLTNLPQERVACSAMVVDLTTGKVIIEVGANRKLIPASNQKLWVLAAAAVDLGESFLFRTVLAERDDQVYVVGDGDPGFGDPKLVTGRGEEVTTGLMRWAAVLADHGFSDLSSRLWYDDTLMDDQRTHPSWEPGDLDKWYGAPVGALNLNDNCIDVTVWPAKQAGAPVEWSLVPPSDAVRVDNRCTSGGKGTPIIARPGQNMRFVISGGCDKRWRFPSVAVSDPTALFAGAFRAALRTHGITTDGGFRRARLRLADGSLPPDTTVLAEYRTPLAEVLRRTGKNSQNLFAEALLKRLGFQWSRTAGGTQPQGSWDTGQSAIGDFARRAGVQLADSDFHDGSGLSRDNRMSAAQAVALLDYLYHHPKRDLFISSLSHAGHDGTLKRRLTGLPGAVHAKTGYMRGVRTLSGYVVTPEGRWFAFSVLFNGIRGSTKPFNELHDQMCRLLVSVHSPQRQ
ncbi:MAG: D-alanyl-D-alanine carboxypeptidase/D-alanyl-D-alanine-endopeptidase [bacterium]|nr:D-alanyl-D-alanine carboxypeptidase/D-alanyl-D-alanine-endopeptidase [bacterium]